jgi:hypothetical protein
MDIYTLKVTLTDGQAKTRGHPYRVLAVPADLSLYDLAFEINESFEFDFGHAFGFFDNLKHPWRSDEQYELFNDGELEDEGEKVLAELAGELEQLSDEEIAQVDALSEFPPDEAKKKLIEMSLKDVPPEDKAAAGPIRVCSRPKVKPPRNILMTKTVKTKMQDKQATKSQKEVGYLTGNEGVLVVTLGVKIECSVTNDATLAITAQTTFSRRLGSNSPFY